MADQALELQYFQGPYWLKGWLLSFWRLSENTTASAFMGVPSWNLTPERSLKVSSRLSLEMAGISLASQGMISVVPGL